MVESKVKFTFVCLAYRKEHKDTSAFLMTAKSISVGCIPSRWLFALLLPHAGPELGLPYSSPRVTLSDWKLSCEPLLPALSAKAQPDKLNTCRSIPVSALELWQSEPECVHMLMVWTVKTTDLGYRPGLNIHLTEGVSMWERKRSRVWSE